MESLLFLLDVLVITYLLWRVFRADKSPEPRHKQLQFFDHKDDRPS